MKTWIIHWGDSVEVLEPGWLREDMSHMAENIMKLYGTLSVCVVK